MNSSPKLPDRTETIDRESLHYRLNLVKSSQQVYARALHFRRGRIISDGDDDPISNVQSNYMENLKWAPDGTWILSYSNDRYLRIFEPFSRFGDDDGEAPFVASQERFVGESVYDFCWYPGLNASEMATCCYVVCSRDHPVQLYDIYSSEPRTPRCTYVTKDSIDPAVVKSPLSVEFSCDGSRLICGLENQLHVFDASQPGSEADVLQTTPSRKDPDGLKGLISCLDAHPSTPYLVASGSFSGSLGIFDMRTSEPVQIMRADNCGVSQVMFSKGGSTYFDSDYLLFSASRRSNAVLIWDRRYAITPLTSLWRPGMTQQRHYFDVDASGRYLVTGTNTGQTLVYDLAMAVYQVSQQTSMHNDGVGTNIDQRSYSCLSAVYEANTPHHVPIPVSRFSPISPHAVIGTGDRQYAFPRDLDSDSETDNACSERDLLKRNCEIAMLEIASSS